MRPIDADALLEKAYIPNTKILNGWWHKETLEDVRNAPTIEPKQKTGRWEEREWFTNDGWSIDEWQIERCSECNKYLTTPFRYYFFHHNYCPYCGAKMESENGNTD